MDPDERRRVELLVSVADPLRIRLLMFLDRPRAVTEICDHLEMAQPRVSHHLALLRDTGLVEFHKDGRRRLYRWNRTSDPELMEIQGLVRRWFAGGGPPPDPVPVATPGPVETVPARPKSDELEDYLL